MSLLGLPILFSILYFAFLVAIVVFVVLWMRKIITLKEEQNDLLREIVRRLNNP